MNRTRFEPAHLDRPVGRRRHRRHRLRHAATASPPPRRGRHAARRAAAPSREPAASPSPRRPDRPAGPGPNGGVVVRWFIGLGAGAQPAAARAGAGVRRRLTTRRRRTSTSRSRSRTTTSPANILKTEIAAGNAPDIIGPVGVEGLNLFRDQLLDLAPLIAKTNYSVPGVDPKLVDFFKLGAERRHDRRAVRGLPVVPLLQQGPLRRGRAAVPADQGRRPVRRQAVGHGRRPHPRP